MRNPTRRAFLVAAGAAAAIAAAAAMPAARAGDPPAPLSASGPADDRFVVHEWGTFTSVQGSTGIALEGLTREEEALPGFVYDRSKIRDCPLRAKGWKGLEVPADHVTQKMETPVIYFHSAKERKVRVRVDFSNGLLTQWYPVSDLLGPPEAERGAAPIDVSKIEKSFLQWGVDVLAKGTERPSIVPTVGADDPWSYARDVDASWVRTLPRKEPERAGPVEAERYLFYRGLGTFTMPLDARMWLDDAIVVQNRCEVALGAVYGLEVRGDRARISAEEKLRVGGAGKLNLSDDQWGPLDDVVAKLRAILGERLRKEGLREDEARAMLRTWTRSWFRSEGTRVLWIVPRATVDTLLPLSIEPKPDELVRVLVGRAEVIPPRVEKEDRDALAATAGEDRKAVEAAMDLLGSRGRFLEPHLRNVIAAVAWRAENGENDPNDAVARERAEGWLEKLRLEYAAAAGEETPFAR